MFGNKKLSSLVSLLVIAVTILSACATPTPQVVEKEVVVEKPVIETVIVEKEVVVEKPVVETVIVEKEVEVVVTATPEPTQPMVIVIAIGIDPVNLDQRRLQVSEAQPLADMINEPMISRDDKGNLVPNLLNRGTGRKIQS